MAETLAQRAERLTSCVYRDNPYNSCGWNKTHSICAYVNCQRAARPAILAELEAVRAEALAEYRDILDRADRALMNTGMGEDGDARVRIRKAMEGIDGIDG